MEQESAGRAKSNTGGCAATTTTTTMEARDTDTDVRQTAASADTNGKMRQLLFTGFNAFGQHIHKSNEAKKRASGFIEITTPAAANDNILIALSWRYTAYANGSKLWLRGLLAEAADESLEVRTPAAITALAAAEAHCLVLLANGALYKLPIKLNAALQLIKLEALPALERAPKRNIFGAVKGETRTADSYRITHIACGTHINVAVSDTAAVWNLPSHVHQFAERPWRTQQLVCGHEHALLLNANGDVYAWGNGLRGQLGQMTLLTEEAPTLVEALAGIKITRIAAGGWHSAAISAFGDLYTWGFNCNGQLGLRILKHDSVLKEPTVYPLPQLPDLIACCAARDEDEKECTPLRVFAGSRHTVLLRSCGRVWTSGWNAYGQLGIDSKQANLDLFQLAHTSKAGGNCEVLCGPWATLLLLSK